MSSWEVRSIAGAFVTCAVLVGCGAQSMDADQLRSDDEGNTAGGTFSDAGGETPSADVEWQPWEQAGPPPYWARRFSSASGLDADLRQAAAGASEFNQGVVAGGDSVEGGWLMALDERGETLWSKLYPGLGISALGRRAAGGYWTVGSRGGTLVLAGMDAQGEVLWNRSYARVDNGIRPQDARALTHDGGRDAGFVVAGVIGVERIDGWLGRFDEGGQLLWEHFYYPPSFFAAVRAVDDGGFIALGEMHGGEGCYGQRVSSTGEVVWARRWGAGHSCSQIELFSKDGQGPADSMLAVGQGFVSVLSLDGELHWQLEIPETVSRAPLDRLTVVPSEVGISIATGIGEAGNGDFWWIELDHSGRPINGELFTRSGQDSTHTLVRLADGWLAAGQSQSYDTDGGRQNWLFRFGADRSLEFTKSSGIRRETLLPNVQMLADDIENIETTVEVFGPEPTVERFEATDVTFSVQREERF